MGWATLFLGFGLGTFFGFLVAALMIASSDGGDDE